MKHRSSVTKIGKDSKHKVAILRNMATSLLRYERVLTTTLRAKELKRFVEKLITRAKKDTLHNRRMVYKDLKNTLVLKKLFDSIARRYQTRHGGYTRLYKVGRRKGDGAEMSYIELLPAVFDDSNPIEKDKDEKEESITATAPIKQAKQLAAATDSANNTSKQNNKDK